MQENLFNDKNTSYLDEMQESFLDYAMSVITSRALPDVRDGLKPVQRRILYAMHKEGLLFNKKFSKCAGIVGEVLKKYHPHGDTAVYETLVRLTQTWVVRHPLIMGQGNFGSIDGDSPAAYRYTEAKLYEISNYLMMDIEKSTVDMSDNYNNTDKEPIVLPARFPNLLINGTSGIAVGMATNIPAHNLSEVLDALILMLKKDFKEDEVLECIKGPDFPTGALILGREGILEAYKTGKGVIRTRAVVETETKKDKNRIIIKEIPYGVSKTRITTKIVELIKNKKIENITDLRDESNKDGIRIVIELKNQAPTNFIIEQLYKHTPLDSNFAVNMVALVDGKPKQLKLIEILDFFILHRREVIRRKTLFELNKAKEKQHILEGFVKILNDKIKYLEILPKTKDKSDLKSKVKDYYKLTEAQSEAIVILPNYKFSNLEVDKIILEHKELGEYISELESILTDESKVKKILKDEFLEIKKKFAEDRKTQIIEDHTDKKLNDLIPSRDVVVARTLGGFIKRYNEVKDSGRDSNIVFTGDDVVRQSLIANLSKDIVLITSDARAYSLKVFDIPEYRRYGKGESISNFIKITDAEIVGTFDERYESDILIITKKGFFKKIDLSFLSNIKSSGVSLFSLRKEDEIISAVQVKDETLSVLDLRHKVVKIKTSDILKSDKGKAAINLTDGVFDFTFRTNYMFINEDGVISTDSKNSIAFICESGEFVAVTTENRYLPIIVSKQGVDLNKKEKIRYVFEYSEGL